MPIIFDTLSTSPGVPGPHAFAVRNHIARLTIRSASIASRLAFVTIAIRPSCRVGTANRYTLFRLFVKRILRFRTDFRNRFELSHEIGFYAQRFCSAQHLGERCGDAENATELPRSCALATNSPCRHREGLQVRTHESADVGFWGPSRNRPLYQSIAGFDPGCVKTPQARKRLERFFLRSIEIDRA